MSKIEPRTQMRPRKRKSRTGLYALLILILIMLFGVLGFSLFMYSQIDSQLDVLEKRVLENNDIIEDLNLQMNDVVSGSEVDKNSLQSNTNEVQKNSRTSTSSSTLTTGVEIKTFSNPIFPFNFSYDATWDIGTSDNPITVGDVIVERVKTNQVALLNPEDKTYIEEAVALEGADYVPQTVLITSIVAESVDDAVSDFFSSSSNPERVEVVAVGDFQAEVYQGNEGIADEDHYFVQYDSETVIVLSGLSAKYIEDVLKTIE